MDGTEMRTAVVPVWLNRGYYVQAHEAAHSAALLWNELVEWMRGQWAEGRSPWKSELRDYADALKKYPLHSHTVQAVAEDLWDAIATSRTNRSNGLKVRAPWRHKNYRPLVFTKNFGWRVTAEGQLALAFGQGKGKGSRRARIILPMPIVVDARNGLPVPTSQWGEITLCWDRDAREWTLHIPYRTNTVLGLPQAVPGVDGSYPANTVTVAIDPGVIHPLTLTARDAEANRVEALVISGRQIRAQKRLRNKQLGSLAKAISKTKPGSRKRRKLESARKRTKAKTKRQMVNANHHVAKKASDWTRTQAVDTTTGEIRPVRVVIGDLGGFEKNTKKQRRARSAQRQQYSQTERGVQERYLGEKTGLTPERIPEHHTSQTCPKCGARKKQNSRNFLCTNCRIPGLHRDVAGSGNIGSRADNGGTTVSATTPIVPWINDETILVVKYQRVQHVWSSDQRALHGYHQAVRSHSGSRVEKPAVAAPNRASATHLVASVAESSIGVSQPVAKREPRDAGSIAVSTVPTPA